MIDIHTCTNRQTVFNRADEKSAFSLRIPTLLGQR